MMAMFDETGGYISSGDSAPAGLQAKDRVQQSAARFQARAGLHAAQVVLFQMDNWLVVIYGDL